MRCQNPFAFRPGQVTFWTTVIYLAVVIPLIWVHETVPPAPSDHSLYRGLNLTEAWIDLQTITTNHHPYNSHANDQVREYIISRSKEILGQNKVDYGIESSTNGQVWHQATPSTRDLDSTVVASKPVTIFDDQFSNFTRVQEYSRWVKTDGTYFEGNNYYVYIRGLEDPEGDWWTSETGSERLRRTGGVLVNCHFDSVSTGFGATDDGMGCVTLLQLLSYFTSSGRQPRNGIVLLFNDAEEDGLLGAYAFAHSPLWQFCHTFVNLEGAGAGGRAMLFRATDLEISEAYSHSPHPFGSVAASDAFAMGVIRSGTDYSVFHDMFGQRGMDIAFYGPRARYHTDQDDTRHASTNSIWHMLSAALASTERLSQITSTTFNGQRPDGNKGQVQNGKPTRGVWFDFFGNAWATMPLRGLFAWSLTLLVAAPVILFAVSLLLARKDKYYFFARNIRIHSELNDDPVRFGGWKGFFRFPLALIFAGGLTIASVLLLAKFNPFIVYSSAYAVWAMTISLFYFVFWLIMRGSSFVRPSALQRGFVLIWLFVIAWAIQVFAAVAEDRWHIGSIYSAAFLHTAIFTCLLISLLEMFALPGKHDFALQLHDAHQARDARSASSHEREHEHHEEQAEGDHGAEDDEEHDDPSETTPLRANDQGYGANSQTTFANRYRQVGPEDPPSAPVIRHAKPYEREQSWSGHLPQWTWFFQLLLLVPVPVILIGNLALVATTATRMTGTDGGSLSVPVVLPGIMTIFLLLPLTPFIHRITHHIPVFLLLVFVGTFIYNLVAFPFSIGSRYKFNFQQVIDLDVGTNVVSLAGIEEFIRPIIASIPAAVGQKIYCNDVGLLTTLTVCEYDATSLPPNLVEGQDLEDLISLNVTDSKSSSKVSFTVDALDTRMCVLNTSRPIFGFSVEGGSARDERFGSIPEDGFSSIDLWRRKWEGAWNITFDLDQKTKSAPQDATLALEADEEAWRDELKARSDTEAKAYPLDVRVSCSYSDVNRRTTIPAFHQLRQFMPSWAVVTKRTVGLVEVRKTYKLLG